MLALLLNPASILAVQLDCIKWTIIRKDYNISIKNWYDSISFGIESCLKAFISWHGIVVSRVCVSVYCLCTPNQIVLSHITKLPHVLAQFSTNCGTCTTGVVHCNVYNQPKQCAHWHICMFWLSQSVVLVVSDFCFKNVVRQTVCYILRLVYFIIKDNDGNRLIGITVSGTFWERLRHCISKCSSNSKCSSKYCSNCISKCTWSAGCLHTTTTLSTTEMQMQAVCVTDTSPESTWHQGSNLTTITTTTTAVHPITHCICSKPMAV